VPKSSIATRTPSAFNNISRDNVEPESCISAVSVSSKMSSLASKPLIVIASRTSVTLVPLELLGRNVDRDREAVTAALPQGALATRFVQNPRPTE